MDDHDDDDDEPGTGSANYFALAVMNVTQRLTGDTSAAAQEMLDEARKLTQIFDRWAEQRPSDHERQRVLRELFRLDTRAEVHVRSRPKEA